MPLTTTLLVLAAGIAISVAVYFLSGGKFVFFFLPLIFGLSLLWRRRQ